MAARIVLSPKHGVNPMLVKCFWCNKEKNEIALLGQLPGDAAAPKAACIDDEPCETCRGYMALGVLLVSVDEKKTDDRRNPYRTGGWAVVKDAAIARIITDVEARDRILRARVAFVPDEVWDKVGLPREETQIR